MKTKVYLADLTHTSNGIMALTFPLGTAFVAAYAKQVLGNDFEFSLFKFPDRLSQAISERPPQILALSNYSWNLELGYKLCSWAKRQNPKLIVIFGGPNFPVALDEKLKFLQQRPAIDVYVENEGEAGFAALLAKLEKHSFDIAAFKRSREPVRNCTYLDGNELIVGAIERIKDINTIPSPYLTGTLDEFFQFPLTPMLETTRGCPFSCSFCADGLPTKSKITSFHPDRVRDELYYIAERTKNCHELNITDLNFGMYEKDIETARVIADIQKKYHWPVLVKASAGKNLPERIIETAGLLKGSWVIGSAIQSSDQDVLKNVKRSNISVDAYRDFLTLMNSLDKKASTFSEIILALPGDTKAKHFESMRYAIESGVNVVKSYQAMLLMGTDMASPATRAKFGLVTKFRIMAGGVGVYTFGKEEVRVAEIQEIIVGSKDMPFEDYVSCRIMSLLIETYYNNAPFGEIFAAMKVMSLSTFDFLVYLYEHEELYTPRIKEIMRRFIEATRSNLYDSHEIAESLGLGTDLFGRYLSGELGFNEALECKALLYFEMDETLAVLLTALKMHLTERGLLTNSVEDYFDQLADFILCKKKEINKTDLVIERSYGYDFEAIESLNYKVDPRNIKPASQNMRFTFFHDQKQKEQIGHAVSLYQNHPGGISRMLYGQNLKQMYRSVRRA